MDEREPRGPLLFAGDLDGRTTGEILRLDEEEVRHVRALRLGGNDPIRLTDGRGRSFAARVVTVDKRTVECRLGEPLPTPAALPVELAFGVANKQSTLHLVEKAVEFGVSRLQPVECARSRSMADAGRSPSFWDRARKRARSALKQSESARLPEIMPVMDLESWIGSGALGDRPRIVLDRDARPLARVLDGWTGSPSLVLLVGPESGLTEDELRASVAAGFQPAWLAWTILGLETAATAALAIATQQIRDAAS